MSILYELLTPNICRITLDRPQVMNAFDFEMMDAFSDAVEKVYLDDKLRVLIITGSGERGFSTGGDLKALTPYTSEADGERISRTMQNALRRLEALPIPTIAAINGHARGGGSEVAIACDFRVMSGSATIGFTHMTVAVTTAWGGSKRLLRTVGYAAAIELLIMAKVLTAQAAQDRGLVHRTSQAENLAEDVFALAQEIAALPPQTVRAVKKILLAGTYPASDDSSQLEGLLFPSLWAHQDHQDRTEAFLNRKK